MKMKLMMKRKQLSYFENVLENLKDEIDPTSRPDNTEGASGRGDLHD